ncbi:MAG: hypothetical protein CSB48_05600 [Proteobacteria bacterium]|nr:MAG: hypothetical protein CSB48_05600 [Pseudomonadota bacterium]
MLSTAFSYEENRVGFEEGVVVFNPLSNNMLMIDHLTDSIIRFVSAGETSYSSVYPEFEDIIPRHYFNQVISQLIDQDIIDSK